MKNRAIATVLTLAFAVPLFAAQAASAATEIGDNCTADRTEAEKPMIAARASASGTPYTAPVAGVVTKWKTSVIPYPGGISEKLKVLRPVAGSPKSFTMIGESTSQPVISGAQHVRNADPDRGRRQVRRIRQRPRRPLLQKQRAPRADVMGQATTNFSSGSTATFNRSAELQLGSVRDDRARRRRRRLRRRDAGQMPAERGHARRRAPSSSSTRSPTAGQGAVKILVAADDEASITVSASAKLPEDAEEGGRHRPSPKLAPIAQLVTPGKIATYTMRLHGEAEAGAGGAAEVEVDQAERQSGRQAPCGVRRRPKR